MKKNLIDINFTKSYYKGGDTINGDINITIYKEIDVYAINLFIKGSEVKKKKKF